MKKLSLIFAMTFLLILSFGIMGNVLAEGTVSYVPNGASEHYIYIDGVMVSRGGHSFTYTTTSEPTCTSKGYGTKTCSECGYSTSYSIAKISHSPTSNYTAPTCTQSGNYQSSCSVCGTDLGSYSIPATGHTLESNWRTSTAEHWKLCTACGATAIGPEEHYDHNEDCECDVCNYFLGKPVSTLTVATIPDVTYRGSAYTPTPEVRDGATVLTLNTDYTLTYEDNTNAGVAKITLKGKGNYGGTRIINFNIRQKSIEGGNTNITLSQTTYTYNEDEKTPGVTVRDVARNVNLTNNTDYTFLYNNNTNAGTANVSVSGKGNYTGNVFVEYTINRKSVNVPSYADKTYHGNEQSIAPLTAGYVLYEGTTSATEAGTYTTTAILNENYIWNDSTTENKTITWKILPRAMAGNVSAVLNESTFTYDGSLKKPGVTVRDNGYNKELTENIHYKVTYTDNVNAGTGKVAVEGINNYSGLINLTFTIQKAQSAITLSKSSTSINALASDIITYTYPGDGTVQAVPQTNGIVQVAVNQEGKTITITGVKSGTVNVVVSALASDNYLASSNKTVSVTVLDDTGPETITATGANDGNNVMLTIYAKDSGSGISNISVNGDALGLSINDVEGSATGTKLLTDGGTYEIVATDNNGNMSRITVDAYEISYNSNATEGVTGTMSKQIKYQNLDRPVKACTFAKLGNDFNSWNTDESGNGVSYVVGNNYTEDRNITLYAQWGPKTYTAKFYCDYGNGNELVEQRNYAYGALISVPDNQQIPPEEGYDGKIITYQQNGWDAEKVNPSASETPERITETNRNNIHMIDSDVNYYATFTTIVYSNTDAKVVVGAKSKLTGSYAGLKNVDGLGIIGQSTTTSTRPTITGNSVSIENDNGIILFYQGILQGPTLGRITNK